MTAGDDEPTSRRAATQRDRLMYPEITDISEFGDGGREGLREVHDVPCY